MSNETDNAETRSLHPPARRPCGTETKKQERRWLAIELWSSLTGWCRCRKEYFDREAADMELESMDFTGRMRLVEVVERTRTVKEVKAGSPSAETHGLAEKARPQPW